MAKYYGTIGFGILKEGRPGVWKPIIEEHDYYGDVLQFFIRREASDQVNDNLNLNNKISIVSDLFANENFSSMVYATYMGAKWKITNVEVQYPRLILTIGGVYNE